MLDLEPPSAARHGHQRAPRRRRLPRIKKQAGCRHDGTVQGCIEEASRFDENAAGSLLRAQVKRA